MSLYDIISFEDGFETERDFSECDVVEETFQTKNLFSTLDVYQFKKVSDETVSENISGKYVLHRMNPPLFKVTTHNEGKIKEIEFSDFEEYADYWTRLRNGTGYIELTLVAPQTRTLYSVCAFVENSILKELFIVYSKKLAVDIVSEDGYEEHNTSEINIRRRNAERERELKQTYGPVVRR